jgi:hypothetical protein
MGSNTPPHSPSGEDPQHSTPQPLTHAEINTLYDDILRSVSDAQSQNLDEQEGQRLEKEEMKEAKRKVGGDSWIEPFRKLGVDATYFLFLLILVIVIFGFNFCLISWEGAGEITLWDFDWAVFRQKWPVACDDWLPYVKPIRTGIDFKVDSSIVSTYITTSFAYGILLLSSINKLFFEKGFMDKLIDIIKIFKKD